MEQVDNALSQGIGLSSSDLPDCNYMEWYEDGVSPKQAAKRALKNAKE